MVQKYGQSCVLCCVLVFSVFCGVVGWPRQKYRLQGEKRRREVSVREVMSVRRSQQRILKNRKFEKPNLKPWFRFFFIAGVLFVVCNITLRTTTGTLFYILRLLLLFYLFYILSLSFVLPSTAASSQQPAVSSFQSDTRDHDSHHPRV